MKILIVLAALAAFITVSEGSGCDKLQRLKVKAQWTRAYSAGHDREDFAQAIWRAIFAQAPDARALFKRVGGDDTNSGAFVAHSLRVLAGFDIVIALLDQDDALNAALTHLQKQHDARHIPDSYFEAFRHALGHVLPAQLGRCWDKQAWSDCFDVVAKGIKGHN
jgi:hypothetical protein